MRLLSVNVLVVMFFLAVTPAQACIVRHMTYQDAFAETDSTVLADVVEILPSTETQLNRSFNYKIRIVQSERGAMKVGEIVDVELLLHLARKLNGSIMCPIQRGSGTEHEFKVGKRYKMLIKKEGDAFELYWGENENEMPQDHRSTRT